MTEKVDKTKTVFGTYEWACDTANFIKGCTNDCKYCFGKESGIRYHRNTPENWANEVIDLKKLEKIPKKKDGVIMFPSTHDITPANVDFAITFLGNLLKNGNKVLVVTKPNLSVIERICETFSDKKDNILFRFTIGSCNDATLKFWEPNATSFEERFESLKYAYDNGFKTSVSAEPLLDIDVDPLIDKLSPYVTDAIWIGKPNFLISRLKINGVYDEVTEQKAKELIANQSDEWVIGIYEKYKDNPKIKWKSNFKRVLNIEIPTIKGLDI
jgi:DNA repair photolyase